MDHALVSVVVPTYNRADCLARAVDSALNQTGASVEVLVVDDGSVDATADLMAQRYGADARVRYFRQPNRGVAAARNAALREARGDFVAFLDSDDVWKPWKLALELAALRAAPEAGMVWTDMEAIDPDGVVVHGRYLRLMYEASYRWLGGRPLFATSRPFVLPPDLGPGAADVPNAVDGLRVHVGDIFSDMVMGNLVHTSTVLLRRSRCDQVAAFNEGLARSGEDFDFHLRTCRAGPVAFVDVPSIQYQIGRGDQLTHPRYGIDLAKNFLKTIAPVLAADGARIRQPEWKLRAVQAFAHGWIARESLAHGDHRGARRHFAQSLRLQPWQPGSYPYVALALAPHFVDSGARESARMLRRALSH